MGIHAFCRLSLGAVKAGGRNSGPTQACARLALVLATAGFGCGSERQAPVEPPRATPRADPGRGSPDPDPPAPPLALEPAPPSAQLGLGALHTCLVVGGRVQCAGGNQFGQLGRTEATREWDVASSSLGEVDDLDDVHSLASGSFHVCALRFDGSVYCWGHGGFGQAVPGQREDVSSPRRVADLPPAVELAAGEGHTCARLVDHTVRCWGRNGFGQLGAGDLSPRSISVPVVGLGDVVQLAAGRDHTCARLANGQVRCWGAAFEDQLGRATSRGERVEAEPRPVGVEGIEDAVGLAVGGAHTCVVRREGRAWCWGANDSGQLGTGAGGEPHHVEATPAPVRRLEGVTALALGGRFSCAALENRTLRCWGSNAFGQIGDGSTTQRRGPVPVSLGAPVQGLAAGARHACAWTKNARWCWGSNKRGHLGLGGDALDPVLAPAKLPRAGS